MRSKHPLHIYPLYNAANPIYKDCMHIITHSCMDTNLFSMATSTQPTCLLIYMQSISMYMYINCMHAPLHTQLELLRVENQLLLTTLVRFANSLRLDQAEMVPRHVPGSATLQASIQLPWPTLLYSGRHLMGMLLTAQIHLTNSWLLVVS